MRRDAATGPEPAGGASEESQLRQLFPPAVPTRIRRSLVACVGGYAVVGIFIAAYAIVDAGWGSLAMSTKATIAAIAAAPLALGMLWPRLSGFKAFGFEVSLAQASAREVHVGGAITEEPYLSGRFEITQLFKRLVDRPEVRALEINLRDGGYWWPSRLYLVAALSVDFSHVQAIAFVEGGKGRIFVGTATPAAVRSALAAAFPSFEDEYAAVKHGAAAGAARVLDNAAGIPETFAGRAFQLDGEPKSEEEFPRVSPQRLQEWLRAVGAELDTACVEWRGVSEPELVRALVTEFEGPVVPLVRGGLRLDRLVDRLELARQLG